MQVSCRHGKDVYSSRGLGLDEIIENLTEVLRASDMNVEEFSSISYIEDISLKEAVVIYSTLSREMDGTNVVAFATGKKGSRRYGLWKERSLA